jgi:hypothetical protein
MPDAASLIEDRMADPESSLETGEAARLVRVLAKACAPTPTPTCARKPSPSTWAESVHHLY